MKSQSLKHTTENPKKKGKVQPKLKVSTPGDAYELEADAMAERVVKKTESHGVIARSLKDTSDSEKKGKNNAPVRRKVSDDCGVTMSPDMISTLRTPQQSGEPLSDETRTVMEDAFSRDFSHVRIHKDHDAAGMNREIRARAFTYGNDIYFNQGQFSPETPEGKNLLAHELTHVVQHEEDTASPDIARAVELRPPGKGEASAFDRVQELIDKLNVQSTAIQYKLDGNRLLYEIKDEKALSIFDLQMRSYLDMDAVVPLRLITGEGRVPKGPSTLGRLTFDQLITGYVDMEDLLSTDRLAFQSILVHILAERFSSPNYARRIGGNTFTGQEYKAAHAAGHHAQAFHFQGVFNDPSIKFVYEEPKPGNRAHIVFRSTEKKYEVFVIVSRTNEDISHAEVRVRDADHKWYTADEFLALNSTAVNQPAVQPQMTTGQSQGVTEMKAVEKAKEITNKLSTEAEGTVMRKINSESSASPSTDWIRDLNKSGTGSPLPEGSRKFMEDSFRTDFSNVRIHIDPLAANLSEDIHAKAFTYNGNIYFNRGEFAPDSREGKKLIAHELTHVLQQRGEKIRNDNTAPNVSPSPPNVIFREKKKASDKEEDEDAEPDPKFENKEGNSINVTTKVLRIKTLKYVAEKFNKLPENLRKNRALNREERSDRQRDIWKAELKGKVEKGLKAKIEEKGEKERASVEEGDEVFYFFKLKKDKSTYLIGSPDDIAKNIVTPRWNRKGENKKYHVDHILEWQIAHGHAKADTLENFWLWEASVNSSAGSTLANLIERTIDGLVNEAVENKKLWKLPKGKTKKFAKEKADEIKSKTLGFKVEIGELIPGLKVKGDTTDGFDPQQTFNDAAPLDGLIGMKEAEVNTLKGTKNKLSIMIGDIIKGTPLRIDNDFSGPGNTWIKGFYITKVFDYNENAQPGEKYASVQGELYRDLQKKNLITQTILDIPVYRIGFAQEGGKGLKKRGLMYFGKIENGFREKILAKLEFPGTSPIEIIDAYFTEDREAVLQGKVKPSISLLKGLEFDLLYSGKTLTLSKTFTTQDLKGKLPKPFDITNAEITLSVNTGTGFGAEGQIDFEIQNIGTGFIKGERKGAFILTGGFEFEKGFFDKSGITVTYMKEPGAEEGKFSFNGFAEKTGDKTIKSARIEVNYENNILTAKGEAITNLPGISEGKIEVITGEGQTSVVADFLIGDSIPGVKGGNLHFLFKKDAEGKYLIEASSEIHTKFPGIPHVKLKGFYNSDGVFLFEGDADLHLGRFNGNVHFGITNQEVDEHGQLTGKKGKELVAFGKGDVDFKMTDWLNGKIGAEITPDARVILSGKLIPDPHLAITKQKDPINKTFGEFNLPQFTLFGIPRIAEIFVTAKGGFFLNAGIGPLYLNDAILEFENLDIESPERAIVKGSGKLDLPGYAQLGVEVTIKAGVGIAVVEVSLNLTGSLAFEITGNAGFQMSFTWSIGTGLRINEALATLKAQTALIAKLGGKLLVELDLFFTEITLYSRPFDIGEKRWPLGLDLDLKFPLVFESGDSGSFKLPHKDSIQHGDPKIDKETVKKGAMEDPPSVSPAPGKEEALWKTRHLKADATASHWIQRLYERYSYVDGLKKKYPDVSWGYLDEELQILDAKEFRNLHDTLLYKVDFPRSEFGRKLRVSALYNFEEEHRYVNPVEVAGLRSKIEQMKEED
jgi:hypothetical protein